MNKWTMLAFPVLALVVCIVAGAALERDIKNSCLEKGYRELLFSDYQLECKTIKKPQPGEV
jgi:hypothetical protein